MAYSVRYSLICDKCGSSIQDDTIYLRRGADNVVEKAKKNGWKVDMYNENIVKVGVHAICPDCYRKEN